ncbi:MAG: DUF2272 domain-containing protein [Pseudomonadota bacterium]
MPGNPFGAEIDALTNEIIHLNAQIAGATGAAADALAAERSAKLQAVAKIDAMSEDWRLGRLTQAVDALKALAASELARQARIVDRLGSILEAQGITPPQPAPAQAQPSLTTTTTVSPPANAPQPGTVGSVTPPPSMPAVTPAPAGPHRQIPIDPPAFDALCRVAQSEVGHFAKHGADQLEGGLCAVVDTIINRTAHKSFPDSIEEVVNQRFQFSALNTLGSWELLPEARSNIQSIIRDHLSARATGRNCSLGGATHFLNPHLSSANALAQWGNHVVSNSVASFGDDSKKDVHFHGFAPGTPLPRPYVIHFGTWSPIFSGKGVAQQNAIEERLRTGLLNTLAEEVARFDNGRLKEDNEGVWQRVGDYWGALGLPYHGRSKVTLGNGKTVNPAWSAAFISWAILQQGIGEDRFKGAQGHWRYVQDAMTAALPNPLFEAMDPTTYAPQPGDLVHYGREWASQFDLAAAKEHVQIDGFYPSHSDFVTEVDLTSGEITTVGGNVANTVGTKKPKITSTGMLKPRRKSGTSLPWIAVLRMKA